MDMERTKARIIPATQDDIRTLLDALNVLADSTARIKSRDNAKQKIEASIADMRRTLREKLT
jgi:hypothetical protein